MSDVVMIVAVETGIDWCKGQLLAMLFVVLLVD